MESRDSDLHSPSEIVSHAKQDVPRDAINNPKVLSQKKGDWFHYGSTCFTTLSVRWLKKLALEVRLLNVARMRSRLSV